MFDSVTVLLVSPSSGIPCAHIALRPSGLQVASALSKMQIQSALGGKICHHSTSLPGILFPHHSRGSQTVLAMEFFYFCWNLLEKTQFVRQIKVQLLCWKHKLRHDPLSLFSSALLVLLLGLEGTTKEASSSRGSGLKTTAPAQAAQ